MKKFFAVASVTAVAGIVLAGTVAGCSSSTTTTDGSDGGSSSGASSSGTSGSTSSGSSGKSSGGVKEGGTSSGEEDSGPTEGCPDTYPGDQTFTYKTAAAADLTKCDASDLKFFNDEITAKRNTFKELQASMTARKAACANCIFTVDSQAAPATTWGPIVCDANPCGNALQYYGGCMSQTSVGGSAACGKTTQSAFDCLDAVCDADKCGSEAATDACVSAVLKDKTSCGKFDFVTDCGGQTNAQKVLKACGIDTGGQFTQVISVMCGPGT